MRLGVGGGIGVGSSRLPPVPTPPQGPFTVGQAYGLSVPNGGTGFHEFLNATNAPTLFATTVRPLGFAGLFD